MKRLVYLFMALCLLCSCAGSLDESSIIQKLEDFEFRLNVLEDRCRRINTNIKALKSIILKSPEKDRIVAVVPFEESDGVTGFRIEFAYGNTVTVYCAKDGKDGRDGKDGKDGEDGAVPVISIKEEGGVAYWTINGEYMVDDAGQRIPLVVKGGDARDGRTPQIKIEDGIWYYSMDEGATWTKIEVSVKYGDGNIFESVTQNDSEVIFTLSDGKVISIPKKSAISLTLSSTEESVSPGQTIEVGYTITGYDSGTVVDAFAQGSWKVTVTAASASEGKVKITAPSVAGNSSVVVFATSGSGLSVYKTIKLTVL